MDAIRRLGGRENGHLLLVIRILQPANTGEPACEVLGGLFGSLPRVRNTERAGQAKAASASNVEPDSDDVTIRNGVVPSLGTHEARFTHCRFATK